MSKKPTYIAYAVKDRGKDQTAIWTRIGAAWTHASGKGLSLELEALPVDGRIQLMEPKPADAANGDGAAASPSVSDA